MPLQDGVAVDFEFWASLTESCAAVQSVIFVIEGNFWLKRTCPQGQSVENAVLHESYQQMGCCEQPNGQGT